MKNYFLFAFVFLILSCSLGDVKNNNEKKNVFLSNEYNFEFKIPFGFERVFKKELDDNDILILENSKTQTVIQIYAVNPGVYYRNSMKDFVEIYNNLNKISKPDLEIIDQYYLVYFLIAVIIVEFIKRE